MEPEEKNSKYRRDYYTDEARRERFIRLAEKRTNRLLDCIRLLGNTSNKSLYKYEAQDIDKIFDSIEKKLVETRARFKTAKKDSPFKLDS